MTAVAAPAAARRGRNMGFINFKFQYPTFKEEATGLIQMIAGGYFMSGIKSSRCEDWTPCRFKARTPAVRSSLKVGF